MPNGAPWPVISVITPSFNQGPFIEETIRSVLLQGYPNLEYIIIDGGSTDETVEILRKYEPWLAYWVSESDRGQSHAINKGWAQAKGDWLGWLNSDDIYLLGTFQRVASCFAQTPEIDLIYGDVAYVNQDGSHRTLFHSIPFDLKSLALRGGGIHTPAVFWQRRLNDLAGLLDERYHFSMDNDFWLRVARHAHGRYLPVVMGTFRRHDDSKTVHSEFKLVCETHQIFLHHLPQTPYDSLLNEAEKRQVLGGFVWLMGVMAELAGHHADAQRYFVEAIVTYRLLEAPNVAALYTVKVMLEDRTAPKEQIERVLAVLPLSDADRLQFAKIVWDHYFQLQFYAGFAQGNPEQVLRSAPSLIAHNPQHLLQRGVLSIWLRSLISYLKPETYAA